MIPSFVTKRPNGSEMGLFWAIDLGGTNLRVVKFELKGKGEVIKKEECKDRIPESAMRGDAVELFDFIALLLKKAGAGNNEKVGFTFSFPVKQLSLREGVLMKWTKGFDTAGVVNEDVCVLLENALKRHKVAVSVVALVNDTVGTLASLSYTEPNCMVGVILGTGANASYSELPSNVGKWQGKDKEILINMEWGG